MKNIAVAVLISSCICFAPQSIAQKNDNTKVKKINILPVYLIYSGLPFGKSFDSTVTLAFTRHKVKLITAEEYARIAEEEVSRIITKFRLRSSEFNNEQELMEAAAKELRIVANKLVIHFYTQKTGDTLNVISAKWEATLYPTSITGADRKSGKKDTDLQDICCSPQDNIFALVDAILKSKWLH